jgi:hypothetical protein
MLIITWDVGDIALRGCLVGYHCRVPREDAGRYRGGEPGAISTNANDNDNDNYDNDDDNDDECDDNEQNADENRRVARHAIGCSRPRRAV